MTKKKVSPVVWTAIATATGDGTRHDDWSVACQLCGVGSDDIAGWSVVMALGSALRVLRYVYAIDSTADAQSEAYTTVLHLADSLGMNGQGAATWARS